MRGTAGRGALAAVGSEDTGAAVRYIAPMLAKVFKAYDVRATYPKPLDEKLAWQIGYGAAQYLLAQAAAEGAIDQIGRAHV